MTPAEKILIEETTNLNGIVLIFAGICITTLIYLIVSMMLDKRKLTYYKKIKRLIEQGHQKKMLKSQNNTEYYHEDTPW